MSTPENILEEIRCQDLDLAVSDRTNSDGITGTERRNLRRRICERPKDINLDYALGDIEKKRLKRTCKENKVRGISPNKTILKILECPRFIEYANAMERILMEKNYKNEKTEQYLKHKLTLLGSIVVEYVNRSLDCEIYEEQLDAAVLFALDRRQG